MSRKSRNEVRVATVALHRTCSGMTCPSPEALGVQVELDDYRTVRRILRVLPVVALLVAASLLAAAVLMAGCAAEPSPKQFRPYKDRAEFEARVRALSLPRCLICDKRHRSEDHAY